MPNANISGGDWTRLQRLRGARTSGNSLEGDLVTNKDIAPEETAETRYSRSMLIPYSGAGVPRTLRPVSKWTDFVASGSADFFRQSRSSVNPNAIVLTDTDVCACNTSSPQGLSAAVVGALSGITFFVINASRQFGPGLFALSYNPVTSLLTSGMWIDDTTVPPDYPTTTNSSDLTGGGVSVANVLLTSLRTFTAGETAQAVINELNTKLSAAPFTIAQGGVHPPVSGGTGTSRLAASLTSDGRLRLTIIGPWYSTASGDPQPYAGLAFGDAPNGSTSLGVTITGGIDGVLSSGLVIPGGQRSVTANFRIGEGIP